MAKRIIGDKVAIDYAGVQRFFDERSANDGLKSKYNYVLFQDDNPKLAIERDNAEKEKVGPVLRGGTSVLDIGCGIARWGEYFLSNGISYTGIDASSQMVARGRENLAAIDSTVTYQLYVGYAQDTVSVLREQGAATKYDVILVNGVLMYLNDADIAQTLAAINELATANATIYLKESMGIEHRLTLDEIQSEALGQSYSAIYRSIAEYDRLFSAAFDHDFSLLEQGPLFEDTMRNHRETLDYYFIWRHK